MSYAEFHSGSVIEQLKSYGLSQLEDVGSLRLKIDEKEARKQAGQSSTAKISNYEAHKKKCKERYRDLQKRIKADAVRNTPKKQTE